MTYTLKWKNLQQKATNLSRVLVRIEVETNQ